MPAARAYRAAFVSGAGALILAMLLGVYYSLDTAGRLPSIAFGGSIAQIEALMAAGDYSEAISRLEMMILLSPRTSDVAHAMLGNAYRRTGRFDEAIEQLRLSLEIRPGTAYAHNDLAIALASDEQLGSALVHFERAVELDPGLETARANLARAVEEYASRIDPADPDARAALQRARAVLAREPRREAPR